MPKEDIYYIPNDDDFRSNPHYFSTMFGSKKKRYSPQNMPTSPIDPTRLAAEVARYLKAYGNIICDAATQQVESFGKLFNWCIDLNKKDTSLRLVHAAQTGSAKSLTLKVYLSMLQEHSSLIVVSQVDEAIEYCDTINEMRNDASYARCYYALTDKKHTSKYRVEKNQLKNYRCIVISHAMFQNLNYGESVDIYKLYEEKQRDLIVVDERVDFYKAAAITSKEVKEFFMLLLEFVNQNNLPESSIMLLKLVYLLFDFHSRKTSNGNNLFEYIDLRLIEKLIGNKDEAEKLEDLENILENLTTQLKELMQYKVDFMFDDINILGKLKSQSLKNSVLNSCNDLIERIAFLLKEDKTMLTCAYYFKTNYEEIIFKVENIANKLGACVILDATASINEFYKVAYLYDKSLLDVYAKPFRKYSNLAIHKAKAYRQGRSTLYKSLSNENIQQNAKMYLSYIQNIMQNKNDKTLVITHKKFKFYLEKECNDSRVRFTHWGNHTGKNEWSDCNKVMIIGWNFLVQKKHIFSVFNALGDEDIAYSGITQSVLSSFSATQLADDIVQGIMRSHARKIDTIDADCKKTDVYLFYEDIKEYNNVIELVVSQFPECKFVEWQPIGIEKKAKQTSKTKRSDLVIGYLQQLEADNIDVMMKTVAKELNLKPYQMSRIANSDYFKKELSKKGYVLRDLNGKSKYFILK